MVRFPSSASCDSRWASLASSLASRRRFFRLCLALRSERRPPALSVPFAPLAGVTASATACKCFQTLPSTEADATPSCGGVSSPCAASLPAPRSAPAPPRRRSSPRRLASGSLPGAAGPGRSARQAAVRSGRARAGVRGRHGRTAAHRSTAISTRVPHARRIARGAASRPPSLAPPRAGNRPARASSCGEHARMASRACGGAPMGDVCARGRAAARMALERACATGDAPPVPRPPRRVRRPCAGVSARVQSAEAAGWLGAWGGRGGRRRGGRPAGDRPRGSEHARGHGHASRPRRAWAFVRGAGDASAGRLHIVHTCCMHVRICIRVHARACVHAYAPACLARICIAAALAAPRPHTLPPTCPRRARRHAPVSQNDMSKLDTPTAVAFRGSKCEVGELAVRAHTWVLCHCAVCVRAHSVAVFLVGALSPARALYVSHRD